METVRETFEDGRARGRRSARKFGRMRSLLPAEIQDLEVDFAWCYADSQKEGGEVRVGLVIYDLKPGVLTKILNVSDEDEVHATAGFGGGTKFYLFHFGVVRLQVTTKAAGCKKYRVLAKEPEYSTVTICGELDESKYASVEFLGEV